MSDAEPFEHIEKQLRAYELVEMHKEQLRREACEILGEHPNAQVVGVILDADTDAAAAFRQLAAQMGTPVPPGAGFIGLLPRDFARRYLEVCAPAALDLLDPTEHLGDRVRFPIIAAACDGLQLATVTVAVT